MREVVAKQRVAGIDVVSDGEYGKSAWNYHVYERLGGIEQEFEGPDGDWACVERVTYTGQVITT